MSKTLTPLSKYLIDEFDKANIKQGGKKISISPVISEVATLYEKFRTAMDYNEEDVILRNAIERILKRRLIFRGNAQSTAEPLIRELLWAKYFTSEEISEDTIEIVKDQINIYLQLEKKINEKHRINRAQVGEWMIHLLSSKISYLLNPNREKQMMANFMFQLFKDKVEIPDDDPQTKDAQVYLAIRKSFAKEDLAFHRYNLFAQIFGEITKDNTDLVAENFIKAKKQIEHQLSYPLRYRILSYIKKQTIPFFILEDILRLNKGNNHQIVHDDNTLKTIVINSCSQKYKSIKSKVNTAIIRGVIFIFITKAIFALLVESSFESLIYGEISWSAITVNTAFPPILMIIIGFLITTPSRDNSLKILDRINYILFNDDHGQPIPVLSLRRYSKNIDPILNGFFLILWGMAFVLSFGSIVYLLLALSFNLVSIGIFMFFLAIVSFISYRITQTASMYTIQTERHGFRAILFDFYFLPFIQVGRHLTYNISKINIFLFIFDFLIETPFKVIFAFLEQWFFYLRTQRERLD